MDKKKPWFDNRDDIERIKEYYRCHYSARETSEAMNLSYQVIIPLFRAFRTIGMKKYNRKELSKWEEFKSAVNE